ncbi:MAG: SgcJ/EcaC family oxidoreductase [Thioalkalivibrionaceae bacterium]
MSHSRRPSTRPTISGTLAIDPAAFARDRMSFSSSFRGARHAITAGHDRLIARAPDTPLEDPACVVCAPATLALAEQLFARWNDALKSLDPDRVTACYAEDAVLLPTVSNIPRTNPQEIRDYFEHFLAKRPVGTIEQRNVKLGCNKLTDAGLYRFRLDDHGKILEVPARYTFVYEHRDGDWRIVHHHSSMMPQA